MKCFTYFIHKDTAQFRFVIIYSIQLPHAYVNKTPLFFILSTSLHNVWKIPCIIEKQQ